MTILWKAIPYQLFHTRRSFRLWRCWHMETMNIWTHLLGSAAFITSGIALYRFSENSGLNITYGNIFAFGTFTASAATCFAFSTTFHTLRSHSYNIHHLWGRMDILGISILAFGCGVSMTYYAFYCQPTIQKVYWGLNVCSAVGAAVTLFDTGGGGSKMREMRGGVFTALGLSAMLPIFHSLSQIGWVRGCIEIGSGWFVAEALSLLVGVGFFVSRVPERLFPGPFDIFGHSYQLFHTFAVIGGACHLGALVTAFKYRQSSPLC
ncbi:hypothetical protein N7478_004136 [Penicillium angulare]|uniref:uncharacterized protein n=1 Tax=Penicillium angulare TaxID=116970 RepID=UPI0025410A27|nr:uncharacterized protein N7478_004136 [Penicillium angulare]KAJ5278764.1 hypothetical protein N7478_004136 [Penicillium angulare]